MPRFGLWGLVEGHLNFYRAHLIFFTVTPLIFSGIFYASNGRYHISYLDSLYSCISAMTVCGLNTVDYSSLTVWQQTILLVQMCLGSSVFISWVMVYVRRNYFNNKLEHIIEAEMTRIEAEKAHAASHTRRKTSLFIRKPSKPTSKGNVEEPEKGANSRVTPALIQRMDDAPKLSKPEGEISEGEKMLPGSVSPDVGANPTIFTASAMSPGIHSAEGEGQGSLRSRSPAIAGSPLNLDKSQKSETFDSSNPLGRDLTVEFAPDVTSHLHRPLDLEPLDTGAAGIEERPISRGSQRAPTLASRMTSPKRASSLRYPSTLPTKSSGFGGFPLPHKILDILFRTAFPNFRKRLNRTLTMPITTTISSQRNNITGTKPVSYISFRAVVDRNSNFFSLTNEQLEELGGVEYRALNALLWIIAVYHVGFQLLAFAVIAPYISTPKWAAIFTPPMQHRPTSPVWFALFQTVSAYTNTGSSLVDQSMVPFQTAYLMIVFLIIVILAGNTAFPIFLRLMIWITAKAVPAQSRARETLHFLLDHPRRCFVYLFPSHQTWFLLTVLLIFNMSDWFFFMVLDIGNPVINAIPFGTRLVTGLMQAASVRAGGFAAVPLAALAPATKVLYVISMYISVYPIAMSIRSTNVYEEQSLGIFNDGLDEEQFKPAGPRISVWGSYLAMHARRQLSFDMWWLALSLFLLCIVERHNLDDAAKQGWFNIFTIIFELVSAYSSVGISLGIPTGNYAFSGALRPLSKLIFCVVMIRGRHRGLPVAIDRAVMLPSEFKKRFEQQTSLASPLYDARVDASSPSIERDYVPRHGQSNLRR